MAEKLTFIALDVCLEKDKDFRHPASAVGVCTILLPRNFTWQDMPEAIYLENYKYVRVEE